MSLIMTCDGQQSAEYMVPKLWGHTESWAQELNKSAIAQKAELDGNVQILQQGEDGPSSTFL